MRDVVPENSASDNPVLNPVPVGTTPTGVVGHTSGLMSGTTTGVPFTAPDGDVLGNLGQTRDRNDISNTKERFQFRSAPPTAAADFQPRAAPPTTIADFQFRPTPSTTTTDFQFRSTPATNPTNFQSRPTPSAVTTDNPRPTARVQFRPTASNIQTTPLVESQFRFRPEVLSPTQSHESVYSDLSVMDHQYRHRSDPHGFREYPVTPRDLGVSRAETTRPT